MPTGHDLFLVSAVFLPDLKTAAVTRSYSPFLNPACVKRARIIRSWCASLVGKGIMAGIGLKHCVVWHIATI